MRLQGVHFFGLHGVHFGFPGGPVESVRPGRPQPSLLRSFLASQRVPLGVLGGGRFGRTSKRFCVFLRGKPIEGKVLPRMGPGLVEISVACIRADLDFIYLSTDWIS